VKRVVDVVVAVVVVAAKKRRARITEVITNCNDIET
jgi:hypothetical protein